jgi:hypothetical protein
VGFEVWNNKEAEEGGNVGWENVNSLKFSLPLSSKPLKKIKKKPNQTHLYDNVLKYYEHNTQKHSHAPTTI